MLREVLSRVQRSQNHRMLRPLEVKEETIGGIHTSQGLAHEIIINQVICGTHQTVVRG